MRPSGRVPLVLVGVGLGFIVGADPARAQALSEPLRARVEHLRDGQAPVVRGARLLQRDAVAHFFEARNFAPAWQGTAVSDIVQALQEIERDGLTAADYHLAAIEALRAGPATARAGGKPGAAPVGDPAGDAANRDADLQILLTDAVAALIDHVRFGKVRPVTLDPRWNVDPREGAPPLETVLAEVASAPSVFAAIEGIKPSHFIYLGLKRALAEHKALAAAGGWPTIPAGPSLKPGMTHPRVALVRKRLEASGELAPSAGETTAPSSASSASTSASSTNSSSPNAETYDDRLVQAVQRFQERHRLTADGAIGKGTLDAMNASVEARVQQIRVNLERARWVVGGLSDTFVLVNLPAFKVYLIREEKNVWEARVQVGKAGRQTPAFRADMRYLVFNPDWTVPPTILAQDVLDAMKKGQNAIARKKLTIIDRQGREVSPDKIDWAAATIGNFRYTLRQPPGADNALGRVKFIFPNEHSIFLHDTPSRELFRADERTFSSGCIRVQNPLDLAALLLDDQPEWTAEKIKEVVDSGKTQTVLLKTPLPVLIVYWTVSVGATGELRYARDVYALDAPVLRALNASARSGT